MVAAASAITIRFADLVSAYVRMLPQALPGAAWLMSPDTRSSC